jgi:hypothetical protein
MSFVKVDSEKKKQQIINTFLKNRQLLKQQIVEEKIGKQDFQRDVALPLAEPVTKILEVNQKKVDETQNKLIAKINQNQQMLTNAMRAIPERLSLPTPVDLPVRHVNIDAGLDIDIIRKNSFLPPSELLDMGYAELKEYQADVGKVNKSLGSKYKRQKIDQEEMNAMKNYNQTLRAMVQNYLKFNLPTKPAVGSGLQTFKNPYKLTSDYLFGNLYIDPHKLLDLKLEAYKDGKKVISKPIDYDFITLLTKRYDSRKKYSSESKTMFSRLIKLSGLPVNSRSLKFTKIGGACKNEVKYYKNSKELAKKLQLLIASKEAGNESIAINNEIVGILNKLQRDGAITKDQYKSMYEQYIRS